jgi:acetyl esterase/lipase
LSGLLAACLLAGHAARADGSEPEVPPESLPEPEVSPFFRQPELRRLDISPGGSFLVSLSFDEGDYVVRARAMGSPDAKELSRDEKSTIFEWFDDDTLLIGREGESAEVVDLSLDEEKAVSARSRTIRAGGWVADILPGIRNRILWASRDLYRSRVYRTPISELVSPTGKPSGHYGTLRDPVAERYEVGSMRPIVVYWLSDPAGVPRAALTIEDDDPLRFELRYRDDEDSWWRGVGEWDADELPLPVGIAPNGRDILVLSAEGRDTRALRVYLVEEEALGPILWADDLYDAVGIVRDRRGQDVTGVQYEEAGLIRHYYLDADAAQERAWLEERFPDLNATITSRTWDRRYVTVSVAGSHDPGSFHFVDLETGEIERLGSAMPWLDEIELVRVEPVRIEAPDGLQVDSFLALPRRFDGDRPPLVVLPHGGPLGIRDARHFDGLVQYLAASGFAVLQVNYRGSAGRGARFLDAGRGAWGTAIEDDIEAALDRILAGGGVDPERVCIAGASYGGYSALISATRRPLRYRCAVAIAAPSDVLLMFDSSDFATDAERLRSFAEVVGDPDRDRDRLVHFSPAYRASEIQIPVLLLHGGADRRVDVEHAYRMRAMLQASGGDFDFEILEDMSHDPTPAQLTWLASRMRQFLEKHLAAPAHPRSVPDRDPAEH